MTTIPNIVVKDVEKRKSPSKHYVYIIEVHWSDGRTVMIGRKYSEFFDFQMSLLEKFPVEAGQQDPSRRVIPSLPGKSLFHRTNTRDFALKKLAPISAYCTGIAKMPPYIAESEIVLDFFRSTADDRAIIKKGKSAPPEKNQNKSTANEITGPLILDKYVAIADYKKDDKKELNLKTGEVVEVVEKSESGWWLAANEEGMNGWVPAVYLDSLYEENSSPAKERAKPGEGEIFEATTDYTASGEDELSFVIDDVLEVLEKNLEGWWYVRKDKDEGWVPATYLQKSTSSPVRSQASNGLRKNSADKTKRLPPKRSTVRRRLSKAAVAKIQDDFKAKMMKQDEKLAEEYTTIGAFDSTIQEGVSFGTNEPVLVLQKSNSGWWYGRIRDKRGWIPESYLTEKSIASISDLPASKSRGLPLPPVIGGSPKKSLGVNGISTPNQISKSPGPHRPPSPNKSSAVSQVTKIFGPNITQPQKTSTPPKNETRISASLHPPQPQPHPPQPQLIVSPTAVSANNEDLSDYQWYRDVTRQVAEDALLCEGEEGYFIIRPSQRGSKQDKPYSLTLYHQEQNWNFQIRLRPDKKYAVGLYKDSEAAFVNLSNLVEHYMKHPLVIGEEERKVKLVGSPVVLYSAC